MTLYTSEENSFSILTKLKVSKDQVNQSRLFSPYRCQIFWNPAGVDIRKNFQKGPWLGKERKQCTASLIKQIAQKDAWRWNLENVEKLNQLTVLSKQQRHKILETTRDTLPVCARCRCLSQGEIPVFHAVRYSLEVWMVIISHSFF